MEEEDEEVEVEEENREKVVKEEVLEEVEEKEKVMGRWVQRRRRRWKRRMRWS